jgi:hypothetical protein
MKDRSKEEILKGHLWALDKMRPTLNTLCCAALESLKDLDGLDFRPQRESDLLKGLEEAATLTRAQEIYAASIFLVLDQWIKALGKSLFPRGDNRGFGEEIGKVRLTELIRATANNFRHHDEWAIPNKRAMENIDVLTAAGFHNCRDAIVAPYVLQILQVHTYEELEAKVHRIGHDMAAQAK